MPRCAHDQRDLDQNRLVSASRDLLPVDYHTFPGCTALDIFPERFWRQRNLLRTALLGGGGRTVRSAMAGGTTEVMLCPASQRARALEVLYRRVPGGLRPRLIAN